MSTTSDPDITSTGEPGGEPGHDPGRAALRGGILGYYADQFDIFVPIITLAPAMIYFEAEDTSPGTAALISAAVFASTLVARPLGSAIFGAWADRVGRRFTTLVAIAGFGIATLLMALLPGHQQIGGAAIALLIALRFIGGIFLGGEYTTAVPLAMEWTPTRRRGLASGLITCTSPAANATIAALSLLLLSVMPSAGIDSAYVQWGWRIPFVIGAGLAGVLFVYFLRHVEETPAFEKTAEDPGTATRSPLRELLGGRYRAALGQVFILMTGAWLLTNIATAVLPTTLKRTVGLGDRTVSIIMLISAIVTIASFLVAALLSQRIGRRRFYLSFGLVAAIGSPLAFLALIGLDRGALLPAALLAIAVQVLTISLYGPIAAYLTERFPSSIRATGYGVGYSLALVIPAFYAFYLSGISTFVPTPAAPAVLLCLGGVLVALGGALGPETKDVDLSH